VHQCRQDSWDVPSFLMGTALLSAVELVGRGHAVTVDGTNYDQHEALCMALDWPAGHASPVGLNLGEHLPALGSTLRAAAPT